MSDPSIFSQFSSFIPGGRLVDGGDCLALAKLVCGNQAGLTALAGGGATGALPALIPGINEVSTVASDHDSVLLPLAVAGLEVTVINDGGHTLDVYPAQSNPNNAASAGDQITSYSTVTPSAAGAVCSIVTVKTAVFICFTNGKWKELLSA